MAEFDEDEIEVGEEETTSTSSTWSAPAEEAPVVKLVNLILIDAIKKGASDIHIEPYEKTSASATASTACSTR
jgi:type IV pilus assembly protein PilB